MKYTKRVFAMDENELRAVLALLRGRQLAEADKQTMQEALVGWLLSEGLTARHEFLLFKNDAGNGGGVEVLALARKAAGDRDKSASRPGARDQCHPPNVAASSQLHSGDCSSSAASSGRPAAVPPPRPPPPFRLNNKVIDSSSLPKKVIVVQPMPGESAKKKAKQSTRTPQRDCCVECGLKLGAVKILCESLESKNYLFLA